jgi:hypothetical protein
MKTSVLLDSAAGVWVNRAEYSQIGRAKASRYSAGKPDRPPENRRSGFTFTP